MGQLFTRTCTNQTMNWLMHSWNTFGPWMRHRHTQIHKTHHGPNLGETTTFPLIVLFVISHKDYTQMSFCLRTSKLGALKLGLLALWMAITFCEDLRSRWSLKQSCIFRQALSNDMWHNTCTQVNQGDSWLLIVESQIDSLTLIFSFGYNLCFNYSNGSRKTILDVYISRTFQWYDKLFNPMSFDP